MKPSLLIELHTLTSHAPGNLNRDDLGRPKAATFGGVQRGRISAQCEKRSIRRSDYLNNQFGHMISTRSRTIPESIFTSLCDTMQPDEKTKERLFAVCEAFANVIGASAGKGKEHHTKQLVFLTPGEIERAKIHIRATVESDNKLGKKDLTDWTSSAATEIGLGDNPGDGIDLALFGRMTTDKAQAFASVDASMQVAHAITVHTTTPEVDWFTAVDDITSAEGETGGGHLGETEFNSGVYYKYFSCNFPLLVSNLRGDRDTALKALEEVLKAACMVTPSGKQNSFASHALADTMLLVVREQKIPVSLANAYESPIPKGEKGYLPEARTRLLAEFGDITNRWPLEHEAAVFFGTNGGEKQAGSAPTEKVAVKTSLNDLFAFMREQVETVWNKQTQEAAQ